MSESVINRLPTSTRKVPLCLDAVPPEIAPAIIKNTPVPFSLLTQFLTTLQRRMPMPIRGFKLTGAVDSLQPLSRPASNAAFGSSSCPPRSQQLNGTVERAHRTHTEEFYESSTGHRDLLTLRSAHREWEHTYNHIRPHQALGYMTPAEFLRHHLASRSPSHLP